MHVAAISACPDNVRCTKPVPNTRAQALRRNLFLLAAAAAMLAVIQPPVPVAGGPRCPRLPFHLCPRLWDETHVPRPGVDDVNLYGEGTSWRTHWALWLLMAAVVLGVLAASARPRAPLWSLVHAPGFKMAVDVADLHAACNDDVLCCSRPKIACT
jgi:hypothetical protein